MDNMDNMDDTDDIDDMEIELFDLPDGSPLTVRITGLRDLYSQTTDNNRMRGGADAEDDDLRMAELEEPETKPKAEVKVAPSRAELEAKKKKEIPRWKLYCHYFKIGLLFALWIMFTLQLYVASPDTSGDEKLVTIAADTSRYYAVPNKDSPKKVGVFITGSFHDADVLDANVTMPQLQVCIERRHMSEEGVVLDAKVVSEMWTLHALPFEKLSKAHLITKSFLFKLEQDEEGASNEELFAKMTTNYGADMTVKLYIEHTPMNKALGIMFGTMVLLFLYVMIIWEFINRTFASMIAASMAVGILSVLDERPSFMTIISWIDIETLVLLFGMMILVAILSQSGIFDYLAVYAYKVTKGRIWPLINVLSFFTAILSAFLDNVTMMLLVVPVIIRLCEVTSLNPVPLIMILVLFSNIGAAMTPVGDPPNIIITTNHFIAEHDVNFFNFLQHMAPGVAVGMIVAWIHLRLLFRKESSFKFKESKEVQELRQEIHVWERAAAGISTYTKDEDMVREALMKKVDRLKHRMSEIPDEMLDPSAKKQPVAPPTYEQTLNELKAAYPIRDTTLLMKSTVAFVFVVMLFFLHSVPDLHHLTLGWTALIGAMLLLILADVEEMEAILGHVEWSTLLFFASLFVLMEAVSQLGVIEMVGDSVIKLILMVGPEQRLALAIVIILWVTAIASAFLDNIPVTTMMVRIIITLAQNNELQLPLHPLVWSLAFGACFGGNGTLIGASANVVSAGVAQQHGYKFTFVRFFVVGFPVMIGSIVVATCYLLLVHVVYEWH